MTDTHMLPAAPAAGSHTISQPQLHHVALVVASLDRSRAFYTGLFGLVAEERIALSDHAIQYLTSGSSVRLELIEYQRSAVNTTENAAEKTTRKTDHHLAWQVPSVVALEPIVADLGGSVISAPNYMPELGFISMMTTDPDGFLVEVIERPVPHIVTAPELS